MLTLSFAPAACQPPKFAVSSGEGGISPQQQAPPPDTAVVESHKKKKSSFGDVALIYVVAFVILAVLYFKISYTDVR